MSATSGRSVWWRRSYWGVLVASLLALAAARRSLIWRGELTLFDQGLLIFLGLLLLLPLVSEIEGFGLKLRHELQTVKDHLSREIQSMQATLTSTIALRNEVNVSYPPPGSPIVLERIAQQLTEEARASRSEERSDAMLPAADRNVPDDAAFLFQVRFKLERALDDIASTLGLLGGTRQQILNSLVEEGLVGKEVSRAYAEIWRIASRAIHGEPAEHRHLEFVRRTYPVLLNELSFVQIAKLDDG